MILFYSILIGLLIRVVLGPLEYLFHGGASLRLQQRLGSAPQLRSPLSSGSPRLLIHAVSAGEMNAAEALVERWQKIGGGVVLTTGNQAGWVKAVEIEARWSAVEAVAWMPWDGAAAIRAWLRTIDPSVVAVVESEIWPNLFVSCGRQNVPLAIVSGHVQGSDVGRYRLALRFFGRVLETVSWFGLRSHDEVERFEAIGALTDRLEVVGDLKLDSARSASLRSKGSEMAGRESTGLILLGACTHQPEEEMLIDLFGLVRATTPDLRLVLAPRRIERADRLEKLAAKRGWTTGFSGAEVEVVARFGELADWYRRVSIVVLGGTFCSVGGQSPLEALAAARPVVVGPQIGEQRHLIEPLIADRSLARVSGPGELRQVVEKLLLSPAERRRLGDRGLAAIRRQHGIAELTCQRLLALLPAKSTCAS